MFTDEQLEKKVQDILCEEFELDAEKLKPQANLYEDLGLDSLDAVDLVVALEQGFGIKLTDEEAVRSVRTLDDLYALLRKIRDQRMGS